MSVSQASNQQQAELWNLTNGPVWVELQTVLDRMLAPLEERLTQMAFPGEGSRVLDIGCGAGATTLAMAERLGSSGLSLGVDISGPLIDAAKGQAAARQVDQAAFICADAQTHAFEAEAFDAVISRFGVMFFDDPVAAFENIRRAAVPGAGLAFVAWRSPAENPFMTAPARALAPMLPPQPAPDPNGPGQFGFADAERVRRILAQSGWRDVEIERLDAPCIIAIDDLMAYAMNMGPTGAVLRQADSTLRERAETTVRSALQPFVDGEFARSTAACWWVTAKA